MSDTRVSLAQVCERLVRDTRVSLAQVCERLVSDTRVSLAGESLADLVQVVPLTTISDCGHRPTAIHTSETLSPVTLPQSAWQPGMSE